MAVTGIFCENNSISYVVLNGTPKSPNILHSETYPLKKIEKGDLLDTAISRIENLIASYRIKKATLLVVDKTYGKGHNTLTHPVKHQIEGCIIYKFFNKGIQCVEFNRNKKLVSVLEEKLQEHIDYKPKDIGKFIKIRFDKKSIKVKNKDQREAFAVALTQL